MLRAFWRWLTGAGRADPWRASLDHHLVQDARRRGWDGECRGRAWGGRRVED